MNRTKTDTAKLQKSRILFFRFACKGCIIGFFLLLVTAVILGIVEAFHPESRELKVLIPCFAFLVIYFMTTLSISFAIKFLIDLMCLRQKEVTTRIGLEQAFVDLLVTLFFWCVIYYTVRELVNYLKTG